MISATRVLCASAAFSGIGLSAFCPIVSHKDSSKRDGVDYAQVDQIFRYYDCVDCHDDSQNASSKLSLTTYERLMSGGAKGPDIVAGDSANSLLIKLVSGHGAPRMPPGGSPMKPEDVATLTKWVDDGASTSEYGQALSRYYDAKAAKDWKAALKACDDIESMKIEDVPTADFAARDRLPIYQITKDETNWYLAAKRLADVKPLNANVLNDISWNIVDPQGWIRERDLDLAMKAATGAVEDSQRKSGAILDTLAWVYFRKGDKDKAISTEKEALACRDATGDTLAALQADLKTFGG